MHPVPDVQARVRRVHPMSCPRAWGTQVHLSVYGNTGARLLLDHSLEHSPTSLSTTQGHTVKMHLLLAVHRVNRDPLYFVSRSYLTTHLVVPTVGLPAACTCSVCARSSCFLTRLTPHLNRIYLYDIQQRHVRGTQVPTFTPDHRLSGRDIVSRPPFITRHHHFRWVETQWTASKPQRRGPSPSKMAHVMLFLYQSIDRDFELVRPSPMSLFAVEPWPLPSQTGGPNPLPRLISIWPN